MSEPRPARQRGFSLLEVLIALVVLSTGMLGVAALYVESLRSGQTALFRTQATNLAADLADRIRANRAGVVGYSVGAGNAAAAPAKRCASDAVNNAQDCTPPEMAAYDIWLWKTMIGNTADSVAKKIGLPSGVGTITPDNPLLPRVFDIRITWSEKEDNQVYTMTVVI